MGPLPTTLVDSFILANTMYLHPRVLLFPLFWDISKNTIIRSFDNKKKEGVKVFTYGAFFFSTTAGRESLRVLEQLRIQELDLLLLYQFSQGMFLGTLFPLV